MWRWFLERPHPHPHPHLYPPTPTPTKKRRKKKKKKKEEEGLPQNVITVFGKEKRRCMQNNTWTNNNNNSYPVLCTGPTEQPAADGSQWEPEKAACLNPRPSDL